MRGTEWALMSPDAARELFTVPTFLTALAVSAVALAGAQAGPAAMLLAVPAAVLAAALQQRVVARQEGLKLLSQQDALTGLGNRRLLHERLGYEIARHRRHGRRFSLLALDLDGFKQVNDRFGHQAGDEILREVSRALERAVRDQDTVVRLGGDEFCVLAPESEWPDADRLSERLRRSVAGAVGGLDALDVSVGYAVFPDEGWTPEHLLARADAASIEAKRSSRERRGRPSGGLRAA
jgi:diguanylate cyclase (GGDEF)-like protein